MNNTSENFKMNILVNLLMIPIIGVITEWWQNDYKLLIERVEVIQYHKDYFYLVKTHNFKFNRTNVAINLTFSLKQNFENELKIQVQAYKFASNEYRLFPMRFIFDWCDTLSKNDLGLQNIYDCGNFDQCPVKKGNYTICNWSPNESRFPPYIPGGRYRSELTFIYKSVEIAWLESYVEVKPKNRWEMKT